MLTVRIEKLHFIFILQVKRKKKTRCVLLWISYLFLSRMKSIMNVAFEEQYIEFIHLVLFTKCDSFILLVITLFFIDLIILHWLRQCIVILYFFLHDSQLMEVFHCSYTNYLMRYVSCIGAMIIFSLFCFLERWIKKYIYVYIIYIYTHIYMYITCIYMHI